MKLLIYKRKDRERYNKGNYKFGTNVFNPGWRAPGTYNDPMSALFLTSDVWILS